MNDKLIIPKGERRKTAFIIVLLFVIIALILYLMCFGLRGTAVIETDGAVELNDTSTGNVRIIINPVINVKNGVLQNIGFSNFNKDRYLKLRIVANDKVAYESDKIESGSTLQGDYIKPGFKKVGLVDAIAEVTSYLEDGTFRDQTNVKVKLNIL